MPKVGGRTRGEGEEDVGWFPVPPSIARTRLGLTSAERRRFGCLGWLLGLSLHRGFVYWGETPTQIELFEAEKITACGGWFRLWKGVLGTSSLAFWDMQLE